MKGRLKIMNDGLAAVFRRPANVLVALGTSFFALFVALWLSNWELLKFIFFNGTFSLGSKIMILITSLGGIVTNFKAPSRVVTLSVIILLGINMAMFLHYMKIRIKADKASGAGLAGTLLGMLGVGCAACGSVVLSSIFGTVFTAGVVGILPLDGLEFGLMGIVFLTLSIYLTSKKIVDPEVCKL